MFKYFEGIQNTDPETVKINRNLIFQETIETHLFQKNIPIHNVNLYSSNI